MSAFRRSGFPPLTFWAAGLAIVVGGLAPVARAHANHIVMHGGPFDGVVVGLVTHPFDPATLYLGAFGSGMFKSTDHGRHWVRLNRGLDDLTVLALAIDPVSPRLMYVGTDSGVFVSEDGGDTWSRAGAGVFDRNVRSLALVPTRPTVIYAATDQGLLWSYNRGTTWARRSAGLAPRDLRALRVDSSGRLYAAGFGGVFRSDDTGRHWKAMNHGLADLRVRALVFDPTRADLLYAGTAGSGVFIKAERDEGWQPVNDGLRNLTVLSLLITPRGERFAGTVGGVYRRLPDAPAWEHVGEDVMSLTITFVVDDPHRPGRIYAGTGGLVFVSEDHGDRWRELAASVAGAAGARPVSAGDRVGRHAVHERR